MHNSLLALVWAFTAYIIYHLLSSFLLERRFYRDATRLGCQPSPRLPNRLPYGLDRIHEALRADRAQQFMRMITSRFDSLGGVLTFETKVLGTVGHMTADPKNIQALLATQFHDFELGRGRRENFRPLLGNGIFTNDGKSWEHSRGLMRPQFARDQVSDLDLEEEHVQNMMRALPVAADGWTAELDLQVLFFRLTLDSACEFLFSESPGSQIASLDGNTATASLSDGSHVNGTQFAYGFDRANSWLAARSRLADNYWLMDTADFRACNKACHTFIDYFVNLALNKNLKTNLSEKDNTTAITAKKDRYIFLDALVRETRDPVELRSQLLNIMLAGRDTTASLLGWMFYTLARHPDVYARLRYTVLAAFGSYTDTSQLTYVNLKNCTYLQHCLNEVLRLYPVVPVNSRRAVRDTTLPRGGGPDGMSKIFVRKDEQVDYSVHVMHHRRDLWGEDVEEFRPERWVGRKPGWEYLPFNGGPRICLGQQFALTEASYVTVRLLQRFDALHNWDPEPVTKHNLTLTSCSGTGVKVRLHEAGM
ncbi:hypothetical protein MMC34_004029 [Xylographa carneopallida]|nr:hypothetical protein [Xylographa carneopallida]